MAITKEKAFELLEKELAQVSICEDIIDKKMKEICKKGEHVFVDHKDLDDPSPRVLAELIRIYEQAGWKIKSVPDQKDGSYLEFS